MYNGLPRGLITGLFSAVRWTRNRVERCLLMCFFAIAPLIAYFCERDNVRDPRDIYRRRLCYLWVTLLIAFLSSVLAGSQSWNNRFLRCWFLLFYPIDNKINCVFFSRKYLHFLLRSVLMPVNAFNAFYVTETLGFFRILPLCNSCCVSFIIKFMFEFSLASHTSIVAKLQISIAVLIV